MLQKGFVEDNRTDNVNNAFVANLYLMEIERIKYLLRSYLKARLSKVGCPSVFFCLVFSQGMTSFMTNSCTRLTSTGSTF